MTDFTFNAQRAESGFGLQDFNARYFSPKIGRFLTPDSIVPDYSNPQDLNRYSYVRNSPLNFVDPMGHAPQSPGDPDPNNAPCSTDWCWQNRYYRAHGAAWNGAGWIQDGRDALFYDVGILMDILTENGIGLQGGQVWQRGDLDLIGQGVVALSNAVGGSNRLKTLLGGSVTFGLQNDLCFGKGIACALPDINGGGKVKFTLSLFNTDDEFIRGTSVHELAHIIDYNSPMWDFDWGVSSLSEVYSNNFNRSVSQYAQENVLEFWAESVTDWVYSSRYRNKESTRTRQSLSPQQVNWIRHSLVVQLQ